MDKVIPNHLKFTDHVAELIRESINSEHKNTLRKDNLEKLALKYGIGDKTHVKELAELAVICIAREIALSNGTVDEKYTRIIELYEHQPNLSHRSSQSMIYQQYSTPAPISFIAGAWCQSALNTEMIKKDFTKQKQKSYPSFVKVFEPSAGNGLFTICFEPSTVWVNEIDSFRRSLLSTQGFKKITDKDSSIPGNFSDLENKFDVVISNPPFDKLLRDIKFNGTDFGVLDHIMAAIALETLKPDGKAAVIVGGHTEYDDLGRIKAGKNRKFINYLYKHFNVFDIINIDGKLYSKQGTSFNIRLILIDGKKKNKGGFAPLLQDLEPFKQNTVSSFKQLQERIFTSNTNLLNTVTTDQDFQKWFKGSKIVDKNGKPLIVYHGTNQRFEKFDKLKKGSNTGWANTIYGFFFIEDKKLAENFAVENGGGDIIISAYLNIKKPIDLTVEGIFSLQDQAPTLAKIFFGKTLSPKKALQMIDDEIGLGEMDDLRDELNTERARQIIMKDGYDGIISNFGDNNKEYIAFEPEQIQITNTQNQNSTLELEAQALLLIQSQELDLNNDALGMAYTPVSDSCNKLDVSVPDSMAFETHDALKKMQIAVGGDVTACVQKKLQYASKIELCKALAAEQIDAVATAIYNIEQKGQGIIIGDQTGIGKGRQAAAIIRYGIIQGMIPIFLTEKPNLFSDLYRDMVGIGSDQFKPFIVNAKEGKTNVKSEEGEIVYMAPEKKNQQDIFNAPAKLKSYDYVMSTYSQFNRNVIDENGTEELDSKGKFLKTICKDSILILDESHNAGGESNIGRFLTKCVQLTKGTVFLSATFAKRPSNMPIYSTKTALQDCNLSHEEFIKAFEKGGVALQEVVSAQLVQEGQMIRRERTIDNLEVNYITLNQSAMEHTAIADKITAIMRRIVVFEEQYIEGLVEAEDKIIATSQGQAKKTKGTSKAGVSNSPYFSKLFNVINQMLFSIKAPEVANHTIKQLNEGKKVIIAFSSTMGAFLSDVEIGSVINADFCEVLERGLKNTLRYTETDAEGKPTHKYFSVSSLSQSGQMEYSSIMQDIKVASTGITVSPIDILIQTIRSSGFSVAEVTGRDKELQYNFSQKQVQEIQDKQAAKSSKGKNVNKDSDELGKTTSSLKQNTMALVLSRKKEDAKDSFRRFQNNEIDVLLINQSGSTGASAHAIPTKSVPAHQVKQRVMIFLQPELDINRQVQKMGRINRTGQILLPQYDYMTSIIPAEQRLMMMLQKKIKSLDANTSSNQSNSSNLIDVPDFLNKYGDRVVFDYLVSNPRINKMIGDPAEILENQDEAKTPSAEKLADLSHKVSGRIAILSVKDQEHFYSNVLDEYAKYVTSLKQQGKYDLEMETKNFEAQVLESTPVFINPNPGKSVFANHSFLEKVEINNLIKPYSQFEVKERIDKAIEGFSTPTDYCQYIIDQIESFASKKLEMMKTEIEKDFELKIANISSEKGFLKLETDQEREMYLKVRKSALESGLDEKTKLETNKYDNQINYIVSTIRFFTPGKSVLFPTATFESGASYTKAIFLQFDINLKKENPYTPGNIYLSFALSDSNRHFDVNLANEGRDQLDMCKGNSYNIQTNYLSDWTELCSKSNKNRVERYLITGNLLQTITMKDYSNGKLVNYTVMGGGVSKGYILPDKWLPDFELNSSSGKANIEVPVPVFMARDFIKKNASSRNPIKTNTVVSFARTFSGVFTVNVPRSKQQGGFILMDHNLLKLVDGNNFNTQGNLMVATCQEGKIDGILEHLQSTHKLNVLVSSEQLKSIEIPKGITPEIQNKIFHVTPAAILTPNLDDEIAMLELEAEALILIQMQELEL
ncbi:MAG TPA: strawberry notch C-terminal domain-containing protein, partial [Bacteroidia bacterium]